MELDAVFLSRLQFAFTVAFHIIFPTFTIGLSAWIATLLVLWRRSGQERYRTLARFWTRIFAVSFAMGVVSGIVLSYQFGTNWSRFSDIAGNVISPLLAYEGLTAFFLEATFLGVLLFGRKLVPPSMHFVAAVLVAAGTLSSSYWILATNSWMQTPAGYEFIDGFQGTEGGGVALGLGVVIKVRQGFDQGLGRREIPGQDSRGQDLAEEGKAVAEHLTGDEGPGDPLAESRDGIPGGHPEDDVV